MKTAPLGIALSTALLSAGLWAAPPKAGVADDVLHKRAVVIDTHADTTQVLTYYGADISKPDTDLQLDLSKASAGGLDAQFFSIFPFPLTVKPAEFYAQALHQIETIERVTKANPARMRIARSAAEIRANAKANVLSALLGVEGGHALLPGDETAQLEHLRVFARHGVRYMTLTWSNSNDIGGSSGDAGEIRGLTPFGHRVVKEMNRLGVVVDLSHVSDATFWDAVRASDKPVLASHSAARSLTNIPRNMTDAMLKAVAKNGGAVCVNFGSGFLDEGFHAQEKALWSRPRKGSPLEKWRQTRADAAKLSPQVPLSRLVDHIEHAVKVAGADHVCLGSDFDGVLVTPVGLEDVSKLPALTAALRARGITPADVEKILGGNVLRVLEANERH